MLKVGSIEKKNDEYLINREHYRQGWVFKDEDAYRNRKDEPCYVPELDNSMYTGQDILDMCNSQQEFADELFEALDWQHPETLVDEWLRHGEWVVCEGCERLVNYGDGCNDKVCPNCGKEVDIK